MEQVVVQTRPRVATASRIARELLPEMAQAFFAAGREAATHDDPAILHQFRIAAKRFRYTLELFASCYRAEEAKGRLASIRAVQQSLGEMNDLATVERLTGRPLGRDINRKIAEFRTIWQGAFAPPAAEAEWTKWLGSRPARVKKKR
jgi:CHAD domain-containing protein